MSDELVNIEGILYVGDASIVVLIQFDDDSPIELGKMDSDGEFTIKMKYSGDGDSISFAQDSPAKTFRIFLRKIEQP